MKQNIPIPERAFKTLLENKEALLEDAKLKNYNPFLPNPVMLTSVQWYKNITKMFISFVMVFIFSPKGMLLDFKEGRFKRFFYKSFILFFISIPFTLVFFVFCFLVLASIITPIIAIILKLIN